MGGKRKSSKNRIFATQHDRRERRISVAYVSQIRLQSSVFCEKILQPETRRRNEKEENGTRNDIWIFFCCYVALSVRQYAAELWIGCGCDPKHLTSTHIIYILASLYFFCETLNGTAFRKVKLTHSRFLQID